MRDNMTVEIEKLGRELAEDVAGASAVEQVEVVPGEDFSDRPIYHFSFLIDQSLAGQRAGLVRIRLIQRLREALIARGDDHLPMIQILSRADWDKRAGARPF